ncbi:MAG: leucine-rich repeat protein, partial [Oscillospiraceae bacterium]|nr:leucine-rich repeat protein [Oscillospiraceae bacterium]
CLSEVTIPNSVKSIGHCAFLNCDSLKEVTIPNSVKSIGDCTFGYGDRYSIMPKRYDFDFTISGTKGTVAETYAKENDCTFVDLNAEPAQEITLGDADCSGEVDILDVITVNKAILGKESLSEYGLQATDFNGNSKPDSTESLTILKFIVGLITDFSA